MPDEGQYIALSQTTSIEQAIAYLVSATRDMGIVYTQLGVLTIYARPGETTRQVASRVKAITDSDEYQQEHAIWGYRRRLEERLYFLRRDGINWRRVLEDNDLMRPDRNVGRYQRIVDEHIWLLVCDRLWARAEELLGPEDRVTLLTALGMSQQNETLLVKAAKIARANLKQLTATAEAEVKAAFAAAKA